MSEFTEKLHVNIHDESPYPPELVENNPPVVYRQNCLYIVSAILIVGDEVLLVREAKPSCYGQLYLPAGKVDQHETLEVRKGIFFFFLQRNLIFSKH